MVWRERLKNMEEMKTEEWGWCDEDGENVSGPFPTKEEAIADATKVFFDDPERDRTSEVGVMVGRCVHFKVRHYFDTAVETVLENAVDRATDDGWDIEFHDEDEADKALAKLMADWAATHVKDPKQWHLDSSERVGLTAPT